MTARKSRWGTTVRHGTYSGWARHQKDGERPCTPCFEAKAAYDKRRLAAPELTQRNRLRAGAQQRARTVLARRHADEYRALYLAELRQLDLPAGPRRNGSKR